MCNLIPDSFPSSTTVTQTCILPTACEFLSVSFGMPASGEFYKAAKQGLNRGGIQLHIVLAFDW